MECGGVVSNKYLHKKFKKQTSIEPPTAPAPPASSAALTNGAAHALINHHVPSEFWPHSTNATHTKSSISAATGDEYAAYHLVRQEPPGATALVLRADQSDEDISQCGGTRAAKESAEQLSSEPKDAPASAAGKYVCHFCNLACSKPSVLQKHIRAHTNERPYPCQSCNFSFKTRSNLYKHCRSRTHVNRVMGSRGGPEVDAGAPPAPALADAQPAKQPASSRPYKPRFHTILASASYEPENEENSLAHSNERNATDTTIEYINDLIVRNRSIVSSCSYAMAFDAPPKGLPGGATAPTPTPTPTPTPAAPIADEQPLNLTSKNRKRCMSEASSEPAKKSLIKELLLKNLYADRNMQCPHCKMIFRTFTELELHKMKMCKGRGSGARHHRSTSVNVASILTQNKNAFDGMAQMAMYPLKSPGPFLGRTRLVDADKGKSLSCDDTTAGSSIRDIGQPYRYDLPAHPAASKGVKLFGGGEIKAGSANQPPLRLDDETYQNGHAAMDHKQLRGNRVVRNTLQSGGIVLHQQVEKPSVSKSNGERSNIMDFSQNAAKQLAPNLKQLNLTIPGISAPAKLADASQPALLAITPDLANGPLNLLVNGKVVPYVPGMPGPVIAEAIRPKPVIQITPSPPEDVVVEAECEVDEQATTMESIPSLSARRRFKRPDSLPLKPSATSLKHHHGLTPTMFNQILISPDTPRGDKKYNEQLIHGNYFSNLVLKSSTRPVYCTLNKTQPFYVPHFKKLSMYSEWRQQDNKADKLYASNYDSRQRSAKVTIAGKYPSYTRGSSRSSDAPTGYPTCPPATRDSHEAYACTSNRISDASSTRNQEHEAAYGLLSLSQKAPRGHDGTPQEAKTSIGTLEVTNCSFINAEQLVHVSKTNYAKNKILDQNISLSAIRLADGQEPPGTSKENDRTSRPLTYPYTTPHTANSDLNADPMPSVGEIGHFNVIKRYTPRSVGSEEISPKRRMSSSSECLEAAKAALGDPEVMDLSVNLRVNSNCETTPASREYDISAMETLAELATKQEKLDKNSVAKNVATEFLKLATKHESKTDEKAYAPAAKADMMVKSEENKHCAICKKSFSKPSQLRLHMNIHYLERPYRCESCSVSFRTKGHLQKHERSAGHNNKLSTSPALSSQEPRPFKCSDCSIAFRIHGHLAKHLRSKMHILKLECLSKVPFGLYAELERSNSLLTEINTADVEQCLDSLKALAKRIFINDPKKLDQLRPHAIDADPGR